MIFIALDMVDQFTLFYTTFRDNTLQNDKTHWVCDLQLHLRYRNSISNKETKIRYCCFPFYTDHLFSFNRIELFFCFVPFVFPMLYCVDFFVSLYPYVLQVLTLRRSQIFPRQKNPISQIILLHEKFLQFDWLRAVVFQLNLKYLHVKITKLLRVAV